MSKATEPNDILWKNMKGVRGLFIFRRAVLFTIGMLIIFFVSSPAVVLMHVKAFDTHNMLSFDWTYNLPWGGFFHQHTGPFIIILINQILLQFIDVASVMETYETHSLYQRAVYIKSVLYLNLNMLVIPALTLTSDRSLTDPKYGEPSSLWTFINTHHFNFTEILAEFYLGNNGVFFVSLIVQ
jgi:hypothetical protein